MSRTMVLLVTSLFLGSTITVTADTETASLGSNRKTVPTMTTLRDKKWIHGSADCKTNKDPAIKFINTINPATYSVKTSALVSKRLLSTYYSATIKYLSWIQAQQKVQKISLCMKRYVP